LILVIIVSGEGRVKEVRCVPITLSPTAQYFFAFSPTSAISPKIILYMRGEGGEGRKRKRRNEMIPETSKPRISLSPGGGGYFPAV
jgi:hypothetical protein